MLLRGEEWPASDAVLPVLTLIIWGICLGVGILGLLLRYPRPKIAFKVPQPVLQALQVELKAEPMPTERTEQPVDVTPLPAEEIAPAPLVVAQPSQAIAFAVPVAGPVHVAPLNQAPYSRPILPAPQPPRVRTLTFGEGEGRQPAPEYPRRALQERQQGVVQIQFVVGESGQVTSAEATQPCPWPALNEAALRTVRERWRFPAGALRIYEIAIRFQITN